jgi:hypothetical protein
MNVERLSILENALRSFKITENNQFELRTWGVKTKCGTVCCAIGLATQIPELRQQGLRTYRRYDNELCPAYKNVLGYGAVAIFFDIRYQEAEELFQDTSYYPEDRHNPIAVADRIRQFIEIKTAHKQLQDSLDKTTHTHDHHYYDIGGEG